MQAKLSEAQIAKARTLRAGGMSYADIKAAIKADVAPDTIRSRCLDVMVAGKARTRAASGSVQRNGSEVRSFGADEDEAIRRWCRLAPDDRENLNRFATRLGRRRHSVANRIQTLRKLGKLEESTNA